LWVSSVSGFSSASTDSLAFDASLYILVSTKSLQHSYYTTRILNIMEIIINYQRNTWYLINSMSPCLNQRKNSRSCQSRANSISLLVNINLSMPSSPCLEWGKHSTFSCHVTKGGLSSSLGATTSYSWNSCYGSTWSPGDGSVPHTSEWVNSSWLSSVLGNVVVDEMDYVGANWWFEDSGKWDL